MSRIGRAVIEAQEAQRYAIDPDDEHPEPVQDDEPAPTQLALWAPSKDEQDTIPF